LQTIPFDQVDIGIMSVEYLHGQSGKSSSVDFMKSKGYDVHKDIHNHDPAMTLFVDDFIFVKKTLTPRKVTAYS